MNLRRRAKGKSCTVRLPGCDGGGETTVLAHIRRGGVAGIGQKPPDLCGVYACFNCHEILDGRVQLANLSKPELDSYIVDAMCRTLAQVSRET